MFSRSPLAIIRVRMCWCPTGGSAGKRVVHYWCRRCPFQRITLLVVARIQGWKLAFLAIVIIEILIFGLVSFVAADCEGFMSKTANLRIVVEGLGVLVQNLCPVGLRTWVSSPSSVRRGFMRSCHTFSSVLDKKYIGRSLTFTRLSFFLYRWCMGKVIGLAEQCMHERKQEVGGQTVYQERRLTAIAARLKNVAGLSSIEDAIEELRKALGDKHPDPSHGGIIVSVPNAVVGSKGDCGFDDMLAGRSIGCKQRRVVLDNIWELVRRVGFAAPNNSLDVLQVVKCRFCGRLVLMYLCSMMWSKPADEQYCVRKICWVEEGVWVTNADVEALWMVRVRAEELTTASIVVVGVSERTRGAWHFSESHLQVEVCCGDVLYGVGNFRLGCALMESAHCKWWASNFGLRGG